MLKSKVLRTDQPTDGLADRTGHRVACTRLKNSFPPFEFQRPDFARTREETHGNFMAVLQFASIAYQKQTVGS